MKLIGRRPVQYALEGYAKPGDTHIAFPDANKINPTPNQYQVRPGVGMWVATLTASDPGEEIRITIQNGESATGVGSVSTCGRIENPDLWILSNPARSLKQETRYVLTLTKTAPPLCNCKVPALVGAVLNGLTQNQRTRHRPYHHRGTRQQLGRVATASPTLGNPHPPKRGHGATRRQMAFGGHGGESAYLRERQKRRALDWRERTVRQCLALRHGGQRDRVSHPLGLTRLGGEACGA